jgi:hypothetical protein
MAVFQLLSAYRYQGGVAIFGSVTFLFTLDKRHEIRVDMIWGGYLNLEIVLVDRGSTIT